MIAATQRAPLKPLARIMSFSAGTAALSGILSLTASKIFAVTLGPSAIAVLSTLQQIRQTALVAATANGQTALVQGASSLDGLARREFLRTAALIFSGATLLTAASLVFAPHIVARWAGFANLGSLRWLALAVILSSAFVFLNALGMALGAARRTALLQLAAPGAMALLAWPAARQGFFVPLLIASAGVAAVFALLALRPDYATLADWFGPAQAPTPPAARRFFSISFVMLLTGLAGSAALVTVRGSVIRHQGLDVAGQFDAAWNISMSHVTLVLASLQTFYLPSLARMPRAQDRAAHISHLLTLALPAAAAVIAVIAVFKLPLLTLFYSAAFHPAGVYLRWTLVGDYLKVASWILSIPMLAAGDMGMFLFSDLAAAAAFLGAFFLSARGRAPAESAAIAFIAMHAVHLAVCYAYVHRRHAFRLRGTAALAFAAGGSLVAASSALTWNP